MAKVLIEIFDVEGSPVKPGEQGFASVRWRFDQQGVDPSIATPAQQYAIKAINIMLATGMFHEMVQEGEEIGEIVEADYEIEFRVTYETISGEEVTVEVKDETKTGALRQVREFDNYKHLLSCIP